MKNLYYIRHGLSQANIEEMWGGQTESALTLEGQEQALVAGQAIKSQGIAIDALYSSPLSRAYDTARIIAYQINYPEDKIIRDDIFLERSFGEQDGIVREPGFFDRYTYAETDNFIGGETVADLQARADRALDLLRKVDADTVLLVGHGAFGRALRRHINNQPPSDEFTSGLLLIPNCELIKLI